MASTELEYLQLCKQLIEKELKWINSQKWTQRDFLNLIDLIENKSGISISLSTIKRIWKIVETGIPQPATLDALAKFLGYDNWLHFKESNRDLVVSDPKKSEKKLPAGTLTIIAGIVLVSILIFFFIQRSGRTPRKSSLSYDPEQINFTCTFSAGDGVPNTVIFDYDVQDVRADSFFIQQSWDERQKAKVLKTGNKLTCIYYYPGYHKARLIANDSIIMQTGVPIRTNNWLAMVRKGYMDEIPVYIRNTDLIRNRELHVTKEDLETNGAALDDETLVSYYYVTDFGELSSSEFDFKIRVRCDSIFNFTCPHITVILLGEDDMNFVPLTIKGCVGFVNVKMGDAMISGRNSDLSSFGVDLYKWQDLEIRAENGVALVRLNNEMILELPFNEDIGNLVGFNINFSGSGSVDYVGLEDGEGTMVYETGFDSPDRP